MQAIILAAGMGKRLGALTENNTKCMIEVNGHTLISRMLSQLDKQDLDRIVIVIGYKGEKLKQYITSLAIETPIVYVENKIYDQTNNIYSLFLAKDYLSEKETILLESDLIFEDKVLDKLMNADYPNLALVAKFESWMDGTVVTLDEEQNIKHFISPKDFQFEEIPKYYKTVNIYKFSVDYSNNYYIPFLKAYSTALGNNEYYEQVLRVITLLDKNELKVLHLTDETWYEIDDIQDLDIAESMFADDKEKVPKIEQRYGGYWRYPQLIDFCYLVNPFFPNKRLLAEIKANFERLIEKYPSGMRVNSLLAAKNFDINQDCIVVGNGATELIKSKMENLSGNIGLVYPAFEEYGNRLTKEKIISYVPKNNDFSYSQLDLIRFFEDKEISTLLVVNPDNPSGNYIKHKNLLNLCQWSKEKGIELIVDESFVDFSEDEENNTLLQNKLLEQYPNLVVIKSISKSHGVPGLRLGIMASANTKLIASTKKDISIWNINSFAEFYMQIYGKYESEYREACKRFMKEREFLYTQLGQIPFIRPIPSQANYFLCELREKYTASELTKLLLEKNILIKDCSKKTGFNNGNYIRIAVRGRKDNLALISLLKKL